MIIVSSLVQYKIMIQICEVFKAVIVDNKLKGICFHKNSWKEYINQWMPGKKIFLCYKNYEAIVNTINNLFYS